ncbi:hypothetical protein B0H63DRAFT_524333 [Podospora didyma]|uniref:Uncharacterized protein n=1 Tax=Podospora didyma TaxID=330526 RepID=A0AAE0NHI2_9PEZI|nr:hypothetical protein B0H63DRAFT_524333 [Podospora didyma]
MCLQMDYLFTCGHRGFAKFDNCANFGLTCYGAGGNHQDLLVQDVCNDSRALVAAGPPRSTGSDADEGSAASSPEAPSHLIFNMCKVSIQGWEDCNHFSTVAFKRCDKEWGQGCMGPGAFIHDDAGKWKGGGPAWTTDIFLGKCRTCTDYYDPKDAWRHEAPRPYELGMQEAASETASETGRSSAPEIPTRTPQGEDQTLRLPPVRPMKRRAEDADPAPQTMAATPTAGTHHIHTRPQAKRSTTAANAVNLTTASY